jgi:hypothetical protein
MRRMPPLVRPLAVSLCLLALTECAAPAATAREPVERRARSSGAITSSELAPLRHLTALEVVEQLRPNWLRSRGSVSMESSSRQGVRLYVDSNLRGLASEELALIPATEIMEIRFLSSREATTRFGTGYPDGVIILTTGR